MKNFAEQIRSQIKPSTILGRAIALKPKGQGEFLGLCPFHQEKTPSFTVSDAKGFYHCFGCGAHGTVIEYLMNTEGYSYKQSLEILGKEIGLELPKLTKKLQEQINEEEAIVRILEEATEYFSKVLYEKNGELALKYLIKRGLSDEVIAQFKLGYVPEDTSGLFKKLVARYDKELILKSSVFAKSSVGDVYSMFHGRVVFPIFNDQSSVIGFGGRSLDGSEPKYLNSSDTPVFKKGNELYGLNFARKQAFKVNQIIVVEGYMDVISLVTTGFKNVVAPLGTAVKAAQLKKLWQVVDDPTFCMDNDAAGLKSMIQVAENAFPLLENEKTLKFARLFDCKDPDEAALKFGKKYLDQVFSKAMPLSEFIFEQKAGLVNWDIPEKVAAFKKLLVNFCKIIEDADLAAAYKDFFLNKFYDYSRKKKAFRRKEEGDGVNVKMTTGFLKKSLDLSLLMILVNYPQLLRDNQILDDLVKLDFKSKELDKIRGLILSYPSYSNLSVAERELEEIKEKIRGMPDYLLLLSDIGLRPYLNLEKNLEEARSYLIRLFDLHLLSRMELQYEEINIQLLKNPDDKLFSKLRYLSENIKQLRNKVGFA